MNYTLGKLVTVTVDRPLGSFHPEYKDMYYPINYGYIKSIIAPDGEEQDAYIRNLRKAVACCEPMKDLVSFYQTQFADALKQKQS